MIIMKRALFPKYEIFDDINEAYSDFVQKIMTKLTSELRKMLSNALIQPHFDYACPA